MSDFHHGALLGEIKSLSKQTLHEVRELRRMKEQPPRSEMWIKSFLSIAAPIATLWATGSLSAALDVLKIISGAR